MQETKQNQKKRLPDKWKLYLGISFCIVLFIASLLLGQRFERVRSVLNGVTQPIQQGYQKIEGTWKTFSVASEFCLSGKYSGTGCPVRTGRKI